MQNIRDKIIDYNQNKAEVEKWLRVKGEEKYKQFAQMLEENNVELSWKNLSNIFQYDKRLLVNNFKYLSFLEEFLRAIIVRNSKNSSVEYENLQNGYLSNIDAELKLLDENTLSKYFDCSNRSSKMENVVHLRNKVAHNAIILQIDDCQSKMQDFYWVLPFDFRRGYADDINNCVKNLNITEKLSVHINL